MIHKAGFGQSATQEALIEVLAQAQVPLGADEIWEQVRQIRPETGRATVFRHIDKLIAAGLLRRVHGYRNCSTYLPALDSYQPLLLCTQCGQVSYLDQKLSAPVTQAVEATKQALADHHVTGYQLQLFEICINCQSDES